MGTKSNAQSTRPLTCKLTTPELQQRKATVIASLKKQVIERKELKKDTAISLRVRMLFLMN
jgi:hypothetical protein